MKEDLKKIIDKRNKIKKSISEKLITFQKLDKQISDIKLSLYAHSKTEDKPILLTPNKNININKKNFEKRALSEKNIKKEKIQREKEIKKIKNTPKPLNENNKDININNNKYP